jgi:hypothetical protein
LLKRMVGMRGAQPGTNSASSSASCGSLETVHVFRHFFTGDEADICLFPVGTEAGELTAAPLLAQIIRGTDCGNLDLKQGLDCLLDFGLCGLAGYLEDQSRFCFFDEETLLGVVGAAQCGVKSRHLRRPVPF